MDLGSNPRYNGSASASNGGSGGQFGVPLSQGSYDMNGTVRAPPGIGPGQGPLQQQGMPGRYGLMSSLQPGMNSNGLSRDNQGMLVQNGRGPAGLQRATSAVASRVDGMPNGSGMVSMNQGLGAATGTNPLLARSLSLGGAPPGTSFDRQGELDSSATAGGQSAPSFDISNFPALANQPNSVGGPGGSGSIGSSTTDSLGRTAMPYATHVSQRHQQSDFAVPNEEDFPALPGFGASGSGGGGSASASGGSAARVFPKDGQSMRQMMQQQQQQQQQQGTFRGQNQFQVSGSSLLLGGDKSMASFEVRQQQEQQNAMMRASANNAINNGNSASSTTGILRTNQSKTPGIVAPGSASTTTSPLAGRSGPESVDGSAKDTRYGLLGLLGVIRMEDADRGTLALGTDLTTLGLNLNSSESLHTTFSSPWADGPSTKEPQFSIPPCYIQKNAKNGSPNETSFNLAAKAGHFTKFHLETLFYIFYAIPRDILQLLASQELYNRNWNYHIESRLWFTQAPRNANANDATNTNGPNGQQQQYIYFDTNVWEQRLFAGNVPSNLTSGFMRKETILAALNPAMLQHQQGQRMNNSNSAVGQPVHGSQNVQG